MEIFKNLENLKNLKLNNTAVAIGMFDGIHKGHMEIINKLKISGLKTCIFSFDMEENQQKFLKKEKIITDKKKEFLLNNLNINYYVCPKFEKIEDISAIDFFYKILIAILDAKIVVCGSDFKFGVNRLGDVELLKNLLQKENRQLNILKTNYINNEKISSSNIRSYIKNGDITKANILLGRNFSLDFNFISHINGYLIQKIPSKFIIPPDGQYRSNLIYNNSILQTHTYICRDITGDGKIAKTFAEINIKNASYIELL